MPPALMRLAVGRTLGINQLVDMEWKFGVTAASSELEKAGTIFLQVEQRLVSFSGLVKDDY
ncbi:unnamed protein product [Ranitomeya imitator]|uniref:COMM domain-containing protein n=1 Tax=Ranitomeya imitator TaxID=111125 RepID=A0ABN9LHA0_9NEOB|nr:unnamed protein product [Ranitomeya imitator]